MADIYDQHAVHFSAVGAYVVLKDGERVATIAFKHPCDGAGRLYAYVHWLGLEMVRGHASGYGYYKRSAACHNAAGRIVRSCGIVNQNQGAFCKALRDGNDGAGWDRCLRDAGFDVLQAV